VQLRRIAFITSLAGVLALAFAGPASIVAGGSVAEARTSKGSRSKHKGKVKVCTTEKAKSGKKGGKSRKSCKYVQEFQGHGVGKSSLRDEPLERPSGDVWIVSNNVRDEVRVNIYAEDGSFDDAALARLDELFRCRRSNEARAVDPRLFETLSRVYDHFGKRRIELVSGFRYLERDSSRHHHASAMDIRIDGVTIKEMYAFAESLDRGGMGIGLYPSSGFVHIDFRAPGEPSYRWTDRSGPDRPSKKKARPGRTVRAKKPTS
jgi:uncharacterized protein YcbK (DUF882 family)